jgi:hypothetical protein
MAQANFAIAPSKHTIIMPCHCHINIVCFIHFHLAALTHTTRLPLPSLLVSMQSIHHIDVTLFSRCSLHSLSSCHPHPHHLYPSTLTHPAFAISMLLPVSTQLICHIDVTLFGWHSLHSHSSCHPHPCHLHPSTLTHPAFAVAPSEHATCPCPLCLS